MMKQNRIWKWACVFILAAIVGSCGVDMPKEKQSSFETMIVKKSDLEVPVKFSAKMKGQADVTIMPQVSGQLMKIYVTEGQQVHKGQTLFAIDSRNAQHELESAKANLQAANANLQAAISQANSAKLEYESNKNLYDKQIVSNYMLESSLNTYKQAQATVSQAKASVTQAQAAVNRAKVNLGFCTITSPVSGIIGEITVYPGKVLLNAVASLAQPIYAQGKLKANLKISQLTQEDLMNQYVQTVIDAGSEVNEALADCHAAVEKHGYYHRQVEVLKLAYVGTHELMDNGKASYLEVLTAQESLLNAQLNEAVNMYNGAQGIIALYIALGGATR